ncbi:MAG TPA: hypothetical protein VH040_03320 [Usitatibacter sp.]|nr:hypothetical protein [Usitatibacter sp.]
MKEREANSKYRVELFSAMLFYVAVLLGSISLSRAMEPGPTRTLLLVTPMIPLMLAVWAIARHFRRMDEFIRLRSLESLAIAAGITAGLSLTYGFLESAGFPKVSMFWVWTVMGAAWGACALLRRLVSR